MKPSNFSSTRSVVVWLMVSSASSGGVLSLPPPTSKTLIFEANVALHESSHSLKAMGATPQLNTAHSYSVCHAMGFENQPSALVKSAPDESHQSLYWVRIPPSIPTTRVALPTAQLPILPEEEAHSINTFHLYKHTTLHRHYTDPTQTLDRHYTTHTYTPPPPPSLSGMRQFHRMRPHFHVFQKKPQGMM